MKKIILTFLLFFSVLSCQAAEDLYHFENAIQATRFSNLSSQLRCLVCQNQTLNDSNSGLANDLRNQIYQQIQQGRADNEIINYMTSRYGDFILYNPPFTISTLALWFGPISILIFGLLFLYFYLRKHREVYKNVS